MFFGSVFDFLERDVNFEIMLLKYLFVDLDIGVWRKGYFWMGGVLNGGDGEGLGKVVLM